jgi:hypothetical protein
MLFGKQALIKEKEMNRVRQKDHDAKAFNLSFSTALAWNIVSANLT